MSFYLTNRPLQPTKVEHLKVLHSMGRLLTIFFNIRLFRETELSRSQALPSYYHPSQGPLTKGGRLGKVYLLVD
jgi:hypothetical protein